MEVLTPSNVSQVKRNPNIDLTRIILSFGVITIHVHSNTNSAENLSQFFLKFCVPFFYITSLAFFTKNFNSSTSVKHTIKTIYSRLFIPFLSWSIIYTSFIIMKHVISYATSEIDLVKIFLYGNSAEQMYYMPQLIAMQFFSLCIYLIVNNVNKPLAFSIFFCLLYYFIWGHHKNYFGVTPTLSLIVYILCGFTLSYSLNIRNSDKNLLILGITLITLSLSTFLFNYNIFYIENFFSLPLGGIGLFLVMLNTLPKKEFSIVKKVASTTYGIYLSHVLFLEGIEFYLERIWPDFYYDLFNKVLVTSVVFLICIIFTVFIKKFRLARVLLLGEK